MVRRHRRLTPGELLRTRAAQGPYYVEEALNNKVTATHIYNTEKVRKVPFDHVKVSARSSTLSKELTTIPVSSDDTSI